MKRAALELATLAAVFGTILGTLYVTIPMIQAFTGSLNGQSLRSLEIGLVVLAICFGVLSTHEPVQRRTEHD